jgi:hypothetical protein
MALYNLIDKKQCQALLEKVQADIADGSKVVEYKRKSPRRSTNQNSYFHLCLSYIAQDYGTTLEDIKYEIKHSCCKDIFIQRCKNKFGQDVTYTRSSSDLTKEEMSQVIDQVRTYAVLNYECYIPSPDDFQGAVYMQQQVDKYKEYLNQSRNEI